MSDEGADTSSESLDEEDELLGHSYDESEGEDDSDFEYVGCESRSGSDDGGAADERDEGSDEGSDCGASSAGSEEGATPECVLCGGPTERETIAEEEHLEGKCDCCERELRRAEEVFHCRNFSLHLDADATMTRVPTPPQMHVFGTAQALRHW